MGSDTPERYRVIMNLEKNSIHFRQEVVLTQDMFMLSCPIVPVAQFGNNLPPCGGCNKEKSPGFLMRKVEVKLIMQGGISDIQQA